MVLFRNITIFIPAGLPITSGVPLIVYFLGIFGALLCTIEKAGIDFRKCWETFKNRRQQRKYSTSIQQDGGSPDVIESTVIQSNEKSQLLADDSPVPSTSAKKEEPQPTPKQLAIAHIDSLSSQEILKFVVRYFACFNTVFYSCCGICILVLLTNYFQ